MMIFCCDCGDIIKPNKVYKCERCIRANTSITAGLKKNLAIYLCKFCHRFLSPPDTWIYMKLESNELLEFSLKRLNLKNIRIVDAKILESELHSYRFVIQLTVQKDVYDIILQDTFDVDVQIFKQMCPDCHRIEANDFYNAIVQVRQKATHRRTLLYLEQSILKNGMNLYNKIESEKDGLDFYFSTTQLSKKFITFISNNVPCVFVESQELISHDTHNNTYNYKYTTLVTMVPICKDDIICLSTRYSRQLNLSKNLAICYKVSSLLYFIDPFSLKTFTLTAKDYYNDPFLPISRTTDFSLFIIIDIDKIYTNGTFTLAHITLIHCDGNQDYPIVVKSHLGGILKIGDTVVGFDLRKININDEHFNKLDLTNISDVIIVKKHRFDKSGRRRNRRWKLKRLVNQNSSTNGGDEQYEEFLQDIEDEPDLRKNVNIYINENDLSTYQSEFKNGQQIIQIEEMIKCLDINNN